jgi:hypothetical protein
MRQIDNALLNLTLVQDIFWRRLKYIAVALKIK